MASASAVIDIPASADQVWQLVGGFNSLPDWLPMIVKSEAGEGGRLRRLQTEDGTVIVERLEGFDNAGKTYCYSITEGPFPVTDYLATLLVEAHGDASRVTWSGRFTPAGISEAEAQALFQGVYQGGLDALRANFSR
ncbi:SRPBCC family protein [Pseudomonas sp. CCC3.1]|uniref:SRPBCC family protein n=1 Tax=Pseudomonas sp. CCC3.1 TaxID=3048607 RepID=UPI002AC99D95|nr:SRPBCC family protein [Pseudomonas sp. CCC3.1]MEB0204375.1 SRPBCC family protein [Pseudomonas sp. CCC3.1]WPX38509.1 SRPBCC family protein [Pseudomonas sp. CCC3.1]